MTGGIEDYVLDRGIQRRWRRGEPDRVPGVPDIPELDAAIAAAGGQPSARPVRDCPVQLAGCRHRRAQWLRLVDAAHSPQPYGSVSAGDRQVAAVGAEGDVEHA